MNATAKAKESQVITAHGTNVQVTVEGGETYVGTLTKTGKFIFHVAGADKVIREIRVSADNQKFKITPFKK